MTKEKIEQITKLEDILNQGKIKRVIAVIAENPMCDGVGTAAERIQQICKDKGIEYLGFVPGTDEHGLYRLGKARTEDEETLPIYVQCPCCYRGRDMAAFFELNYTSNGRAKATVMRGHLLERDLKNNCYRIEDLVDV